MKSVLLNAVLVAILVGCGSPEPNNRAKEYFGERSFTAKEMKDQVQVGMTKDQVKTLIGKIDVEGPLSSKGREIWFVNGKDAPFSTLTIVFQDGAVSAVSVSGVESK